MSRNEWEAGTIKIPTRAWAPLKKTLRESHNRQRDEVLRKAEEMQARLAEKFKGRRDVCQGDISHYLWHLMRNTPEELAVKVIDLTLASLKEGSASRTKKITQAMLDAHVAPKATNKTLYYEGGDWDISLDDETRSVRWHVSENNHAVENARASHMGSLLLRELGRIDYGNRKTLGGVIVGNDEYNEDVDFAGGGANYITASFDKAGEIERGW